MNDLIQLSEEQEARARELHAKSVVVNLYGGPFSAPRSIRHWRTGHLKDDGNWIPPVEDAVRQYLIPDMKKGGVDCVVAAASTTSDLSLWLREFQTSFPVAKLAVTAEDVKKVQKERNHTFILCAQGSPESDPDMALNAILLFRESGVRIWSLTHSARNLISDGIGEPTGAGLSRFGRQFVQELNHQRILVDVSHISDSGFWDVIELSSAPLIATHSNCRTICKHDRNLSDEMIIAIAENNGVIGLNFFPDFVGEHKQTIFNLIEHIDHIAEMVGPEHIGLGPDFCSGRWNMILPSWWRRGSSDHNAQRLIVDYPRGIENITQMYNVTCALVIRGYSNKEIQGILGANFLRLFEGVVG